MHHPHVPHLDHAKHHDHSDHAVKAGSWVKGGGLAHHKAGFFKSHLAGTFHHAGGGLDLSMPSDHALAMRLLP